MKKERMFVYARLHDPKIQKQITGYVWDTPEGNSISGYKKTTMQYEGKTYPVIIPHVVSTVHGFVYDLTPDEIEQVDEFLGKPYIRVKKAVDTEEDVWVYLKNPEAFL